MRICCSSILSKVLILNCPNKGFEIIILASNLHFLHKNRLGIRSKAGSSLRTQQYLQLSLLTARKLKYILVRRLGQAALIVLLVNGKKLVILRIALLCCKSF